MSACLYVILREWRQVSCGPACDLVAYSNVHRPRPMSVYIYTNLGALGSVRSVCLWESLVVDSSST